MSNHQLAFLMARITLGINFFLHGFVRIPKLEAFANGLTQGFKGTMLPLALVEMIAYAIPFIEVILGVLIIFGIASKKSLTATAIFIIMLITGCAFKEDWSAIGTQMLYALFIFFLIKNLKYEVWAVKKSSSE
ncbi:DoxX family protein [Zunongwangia sp. HGR-M22]|uniref:DoxX family protein n=1 Tax=Zunongwangia sp. HGR-M22 TaxID=3015168 RepID=UPI0022DD8661|nr:DoxX family membrane protein [Zunongwangia sp. HGR-M22]WBL25498.1 DoxX family membrane protein [Zunongwangia sp. HGR-M22]